MYVLPSRVKITISWASPAPAPLDALTDMSYGTYGSEKKDIMHVTFDTAKQTILAHMDAYLQQLQNLLMPVDTLTSSSLCCWSSTSLILLIKLVTVTWYPVMIPLGENGGIHDILIWLSEATATFIYPTLPGAIYYNEEYV